MKINFRQLDGNKKIVQFIDGIFPIETDKKFSWVWTTTEVFGFVSNINSITIKAFSEIDNTLFCNNEVMEIRSDSLNIIKLNLKDQSDFKFKLENSFNADNDTRQLGIRIISILVDDEVIF